MREMEGREQRTGTEPEKEKAVTTALILLQFRQWIYDHTRVLFVH